jgi:hypothetical protein
MLNSRHLIICVAFGTALALAGCGQTTPASEEPGAVAEAPSETTGGGTFCEEVGRRVSAEQCEDFTRLADRAAVGVAAFNAPDPMRRGDVHTLQLAISDAPTPEEIATGAEPATDETPATETPTDVIASGEEPAPAPPPPTPADTVDPLQGETVEYAPLVGRFMRAELTGEGFEITPLSPPSQEVLPDSVTTWTWRVVATTSGQRALTLTTIVEGCDAQGQCYPLRSTTHNHEVEVTVGALGRAQDFLEAAPIWLRLAAGLLTALAVLVGAWFGLRNAFRKGRQSS